MGFLAAIQWFSTSVFVPVPFLGHFSFSLLVLSYSNVLVFALSHFILFLSLRSPFVFEWETKGSGFIWERKRRGTRRNRGRGNHNRNIWEKNIFNKRKKLKTTRSQQLDQTPPFHCQNLPLTIFAISFSSPVTGWRITSCCLSMSLSYRVLPGSRVYSREDLKTIHNGF